MRDTILRTKFTELRRNEERRKTRRLDISVDTVGGLKPWRAEVRTLIENANTLGFIEKTIK